VVNYTYDAANRMASVSDWLNRTTTYTYDNVGNLTGQANPNNTSVSQTYDAANRLIGLINSSTVSGTIASFGYTLDKVGNRTQVVDTDGTTTYEYDKLYRLTAVTYPDATSASYQYDAMGNRQVMTATAGVVNYSYDAADRLLNAGPITFTWDADGNMLTKGGMAFTFDAINRLTGVVSGTLNVGYTYDGDGRRASKNVNGTSTQYVYDTIAGLAYVLAEQTGISTTTYTYGTDLVALTAPDATQSYYHYDGLGSTRALSNGSGQVTARYSYDAFGAVRTSGGTTSTSFKFTGEQSDDEIELIYLRARYYDSVTGRLLSMDSVMGNSADDQSLNRYVYSRNNPINLFDPSGKSFWDVASDIPLVGGFIQPITSIVEGVQSFDRSEQIYWQDMPALIDNPNATTEDWNRLDQAYLDNVHNFATKTSQGLVTFPGTSLSPEFWGLEGESLLPSSLGDLFTGIVSNHLSDWLRDQPLQKIQELYFDRVLGKESATSQVFGLDSFGGWATQDNSSLSRSAYEAHLSSTPLGRIALQASRQSQQISEADVTSSYVPLIDVLRHAGYNPAHPEPPPGHSK
jgi:RHS repeat-associated protein